MLARTKLFLSEVPADLGKACIAAALQGHGDAAAIDPVAILAQVPLVVVGPTQFGCPLQFSLRQPIQAMFLQEDQTERLTDGFIWRVAEDLLGTRTPGDDGATGAEEGIGCDAEVDSDAATRGSACRSSTVTASKVTPPVPS